jgi:hypothetical protein
MENPEFGFRFWGEWLDGSIIWGRIMKAGCSEYNLFK